MDIEAMPQAIYTDSWEQIDAAFPEVQRWARIWTAAKAAT